MAAAAFGSAWSPTAGARDFGASSSQSPLSARGPNAASIAHSFGETSVQTSKAQEGVVRAVVPKNESAWAELTKGRLKSARALRQQAAGQMLDTVRGVDLSDRKHEAVDKMQLSLKKKIETSEGLSRSLLERVNESQLAVRAIERGIPEILRTYGNISRALDVVERRLELRARRPPQEKVYDQLQKALEEERACLQRTLVTLSERAQEGRDLSAKLEVVRGVMNEDMRMKRKTTRMDRSCLRGPEASAKAGARAVAPPLPKLAAAQRQDGPNGEDISPEKWTLSTKATIDRSVFLEQQASRCVRESDNAVLCARRESEQARNNTLDAIRRRIGEMLDFKASLESEIRETDAAMQKIDAGLAETDRMIKEIPQRLDKSALQSLRGRARTESNDTTGENAEQAASALEVVMGELKERARKKQQVREQLEETRQALYDDLGRKVCALKLDEACQRIAPRPSSAAGPTGAGGASAAPGGAVRRPLSRAGAAATSAVAGGDDGSGAMGDGGARGAGASAGAWTPR